MLKLSPTYIMDGCPFEVSLPSNEKRPIIVKYGRQKIRVLADEPVVFMANKKYRTIQYRVKKGIFYKRYTMKLDVHTFKSQGLDDLPKNISGSVELDASPIKYQKIKLSYIAKSLQLRRANLEFRNTKSMDLLTKPLDIYKTNLKIKKPRIGMIDKSFQRKIFEEFKQTRTNINQ